MRREIGSTDSREALPPPGFARITPYIDIFRAYILLARYVHVQLVSINVQKDTISLAKPIHSLKVALVLRITQICLIRHTRANM